MTKRIVAIILALIVLFALCGVLTACNNNSALTMENFDKITCAQFSTTTLTYVGGMSLSEVKDILGEPSSSSSSTMMGVTSTAYVWGDSEKNITVAFYNGQALMKTQVGLK